MFPYNFFSLCSSGNKNISKKKQVKECAHLNRYVNDGVEANKKKMNQKKLIVCTCMRVCVCALNSHDVNRYSNKKPFRTSSYCGHEWQKPLAR